jgi:glycosyltransferase involved in cell wall biosynthesis
MASELNASKTKLLFIVPRLHTNLLGWLLGLKLLNVNYKVLVQTKSLSEDYSLGVPEKIDPRSNYYKFSNFSKLSFSNYCLLYKKIRSIEPSIIVFRLEMNFTSFLMLANIVFSRIPFIIYDQWPIIGISKLKKLIRFILNIFLQAPIITPVYSYNDDWIGNRIIENYDCKKINFLPFGMPVFDKAMLKKKESYSAKPIRLVSIGKYQFRKNHLKVINHLSLNSDFMKSNVEVEIIGESTQSEHIEVLNKLNQLILSSNLKNKIKLTYNLNHQEALNKIKECDIFLLLSDSEPASISNIEAMAFGKPVIIKSGNGTANYLNKKLGGFIVSNFDDFSEKISYLIREVKERERFGTNNIKSIKLISDPIETATRLLMIAETITK